MTEIVAIGELLIDFAPQGRSDRGQPLYECNPGGAPANVLVALSKLGRTTSFIGKVGEDSFGHALRNILRESGVGTDGLLFTDRAPTTLAFVHLAADGDRSFTFYRKPGADQLLEASELPLELISKAKVIHFGSVSMTHEPSRGATLKAVSHAKEQGLLISYDPNLRPALWGGEEEAKRHIAEGLRYADIVKLSEEELVFLTGITDLEEGTRQLCDRYPIVALFVTLGARGSFIRCQELTAACRGYAVAAVDTTGAGDAFWGGVLYRLTEDEPFVRRRSKKEWESILSFANAMGAIVTSVKGAIPAMPTIAEVEQFLSEIVSER
jgi:fructokinase